MKLIKREFYLKQLIDVIRTPDIKVITGMRRVGKSKLLLSFIDYIKHHEKSPNIIYIDFRLSKFNQINQADKFESYVKDKYQANKYNVLCVDEIQMCEGFENAINSLYGSNKFDIYITGSNAFLLSSDLATLFTGASFTIDVYPFSFKEYIKYFPSKDIDIAFDDYLKIGGLSGAYPYPTAQSRYHYINNVYDTIIQRDLIKKNNIRNQMVLNRTTKFLLSNIGSVTSLRNITNRFSLDLDHISINSIDKYVNLLCESFLFYSFPRYDVAGLKLISTSYKYYLSDHGIRYAVLGTKEMDYGHIYENIVAIELKRRGYEVYVGKLYQKEIDFVAMKANEKIYIQVADDIVNDQTFEREIKPLLSIKDAYPKTIIARTKHDFTQRSGVKIIDIARWLLDD